MILSGPARGVELEVLQSTVLDPNALNFSAGNASFSQNINGRTFHRPPVSTFRGYQYATWYDGSRNVCLGRRKLPAGTWEVLRFTDYTITSDDSHNVVSLGVCHLDGTIHLAFDHHADPLNYRVSVPGVASDPEAATWSTSLFGPTTNVLGSVGVLSSVTYPYFFNAPNGNLMLYYRQGGSGNGDGMLQEYDGSTHDWTTGLGKFIARNGNYSGALSTNSTSRNPYVNGLTYAGDRLHVSWCWRESAGGSATNHDLAYAYSDDHGRTWLNSAGTRIGTTGSSFITIDSPGLVVAPIPQDSGLSNSYTQYAYPDGSCHVVVAHHQAGTTTKRYHHYWRNAAGNWSGEVLPFPSGSRPKLVGDDDRSLFLAYSAGGILRIAKGTPDAGRTAWAWTEIHAQSDTTEGGEGQIDLTRWETDRILSVYGQVRYAADGSPTPLHVFDYQVSGQAILPQPLRGESGVTPSPTLGWTAGIGAVSHRVFLGTDAAAVAAATTASPEYLGEQGGTQFAPSASLAETTTYYWRIDEVDAGSNVHPGLVWSFTTTGNFPPTFGPLADQILPWGATSSDLPVEVADDLTAPGELILTAGSSNPVLLPAAGISLGGTGAARTIRLAPNAGETGSSIVTLTVDDGTHQAEASFLLTVTDTAWQLLSSAHDASVRDNPDVVDVDKAITLLGTGGSSSNRVDRCTVYVFRLPDFGPVADPFTSTTFHFEYTAKQGNLRDNDLYGLGRRSDPAVLAGDYHGRTATPDPAAQLLEASILTDTTPFGVLGTSAAGSTALRDYLNSQYASGAGAGEHVFLRLSTAGFENSIDRATLTMSEGGSASPVDTRPRISLTADPFSARQKWRRQHFGSMADTGIGADEADADGDGENNFLEFATGQGPWDGTRATTGLSQGSPGLEFSYVRSIAALADGVLFTVEWSDSLLAGSWSTAGVAQSVSSDDGTLQTVLATVPAGPGPTRFVRLMVEQP